MECCLFTCVSTRLGNQDNNNKDWVSEYGEKEWGQVV